MNRREAIAALMSLPAATRITQATIEPSDAIIIECERVLNPEEMTNIQAQVQRIWPDRKVVVLAYGLKMKIAKTL